MLYLAARNEHLVNVIKPALYKKKIVICDRFVDSTMAYQVYGKKVNKKFIDNIHHIIIGKLKADITFVLTVKIGKALDRLKKRKLKNRYDKFSKKFYINAQNSFIKIAKQNKKSYFIFDNSSNDSSIHKKILNIINKKLNVKN